MLSILNILKILIRSILPLLILTIAVILIVFIISLVKSERRNFASGLIGEYHGGCGARSAQPFNLL